MLGLAGLKATENKAHHYEIFSNMLLPSLRIKSVFSTSFPNAISLLKWQEHYCEETWVTALPMNVARSDTAAVLIKNIRKNGTVGSSDTPLGISCSISDNHNSIILNYTNSKTRLQEQLNTPVSLTQKYEAGIKMLYEYAAWITDRE